LLRLSWLALPILASIGVWALYGRRPDPRAPERLRRRGLHLWPYILAGVISFVGVAAAGLPPALGLLPVIPAIPHADRSFGLFAEAESFLHDPLNRLAHLLVKPLGVVLFLFGLTRGGIDLQAFAPTTLTLLAAFWLGKPLGFLLGCVATAQLLRAPLPKGVGLRHLTLIALLLGIGFTVPVLALDTALPGGGMAEAARLGLAISLLAGVATLALPRRFTR
jgi:NhaA family Na+:H+ antiporter